MEEYAIFACCLEHKECGAVVGSSRDSAGWGKGARALRPSGRPRQRKPVTAEKELSTLLRSTDSGPWPASYVTVRQVP